MKRLFYFIRTVKKQGEKGAKTCNEDAEVLDEENVQYSMLNVQCSSVSKERLF